MKNYNEVNLKFYWILLLNLMAINAFAHGMNTPGPHGGEIKMPGMYHTELVLNNKIAKIYLLDTNFKNPVIKDSYVNVWINKRIIKCLPNLSENYFSCPIGNVKGLIKIKSSRLKSSEGISEYNISK